MRDAGASFAVEVTPHDELIPQIESIKELVYREVGAWPHIRWREMSATWQGFRY